MSAKVRGYNLYGMRIRSEIHLHEPELVFDRPDVEVRWGEPADMAEGQPEGEVVAELDRGGTRLYTATRERCGYRLRFHGLCDFLVSPDLGSVECRMVPGVERGYASILLAGTVCAFILGLAGDCVLHASVVEHEGSALALSGPSGSGKSTLAALLCAAGARLVTDDVLRLVVDGRARCVGRSSEIRLRPGATGVIDAFGCAPPQRPTADERVALRPPATEVHDPPLGSFVLPSPTRGTNRVAIERVAGPDALFELIGIQRVEGWMKKEVLEAQFGHLSRVASEVPVLRARVPWDVPFSRVTGEALLEAVQRAAG